MLLTDAWHLDDLHLSRPECRRTEPSPKEVILKERSGLGYKYVQRTYNCLMGMAKFGRRWLSDIANAETSIFIARTFETMHLQPVNEAWTFPHRCYHPFPRNYVKRL